MITKLNSLLFPQKASEPSRGTWGRIGGSVAFGVALSTLGYAAWRYYRHQGKLTRVTATAIHPSSILHDGLAEMPNPAKATLTTANSCSAGNIDFYWHKPFSSSPSQPIYLRKTTFWDNRYAAVDLIDYLIAEEGMAAVDYVREMQRLAGRRSRCWSVKRWMNWFYAHAPSDHPMTQQLLASGKPAVQDFAWMATWDDLALSAFHADRAYYHRCALRVLPQWYTSDALNTASEEVLNCWISQSHPRWHNPIKVDHPATTQIRLATHSQPDSIEAFMRDFATRSAMNYYLGAECDMARLKYLREMQALVGPQGLSWSRKQWLKWFLTQAPKDNPYTQLVLAADADSFRWGIERLVEDAMSWEVTRRWPFTRNEGFILRSHLFFINKYAKEYDADFLNAVARQYLTSWGGEFVPWHQPF